MIFGLLAIALVFGVIFGGIWLSVAVLRGMARAVLAQKPWVATLSRVAVPLYIGNGVTHWVMGSARLNREMGDWAVVLNSASIVLMSLALTSMAMRFYARRSDMGMMVMTGLFTAIAGAVASAVLLLMI